MEVDKNEERLIKNRIYMREYKKKKYHENKDECKKKSRMYYHLHNSSSMCIDDVQKYGILLPEMNSIIKNIEKIKQSSADIEKIKEMKDFILEVLDCL